MTEQHLDENQLIATRREKLNKLRASKKTAYPNQFRRSAYNQELQQKYQNDDKPTLEQKKEHASVVGRIMLSRGPFMVIEDVSGRIQLYIDRKILPEDLANEIKTWDLGDIVFATGQVARSGRGDLYIHMQSAELLSKALRPLPDKHKGLADTELCYRQRYVDLIVNEQSRQIFATRVAIIQYLRQFLDARGFMEVETPMMHVIPGGATARPFVTHHNALDMDLYLRIAPELYLKRLIVGGFERVYEINRNFRNEGLSSRHNPEFTMVEFYQAYSDYHELMDMTETLLRGIAVDVIGSSVIEHAHDGARFDFAKPFARLTVLEAILQFNQELTLADLQSVEQARAVATRLKIPYEDSFGLGKLQIEIFEATVEHQLIQPTFITAYPAEVSPLARLNDDNPFVTDRFELFIGGRELANGFSELNDPEDQAARFAKQVAQKDAGDLEAMHFDADYIRALEYAMAPTAGEGIGIDRLVMLFTGAASIRDVLLFPHMRPE